jgi:hypothetical protein
MAITAPRFMCSTLALAHSLHPLSGLEYNDSFIYFESISFHFLLVALKSTIPMTMMTATFRD